MPHVQTAHVPSWTVLRFPSSLLVILLAALTASAQTPQDRYLAYSTYTDPNPLVQLDDGAVTMGANSSGQVCVATQYLVILINPDGTFAYSNSTASQSRFFGGVAVDVAGNCYVHGYGDITPTPGAYQSHKSSAQFVIKLNPQGGVVFATYLAGSGSDFPGGIALDSSGNVWVTGYTNSNDFPVTKNAIQSSFQGGEEDAFIAELNPSGTQLLYGTYLGGSSDDFGAGTAVDNNDNVLVSGTTFSPNFPTMNALEPTLGGGYDAFITKFSNAGQLLYSTYFGQSSFAWGGGIATDSAGEIFLTGYSLQSGLSLVNPIPNQVPGTFVTKLNSAGSALIYSTFFGLSSGGTNSAGTIQVDVQGNAIFAGTETGIPLLNPIESELFGNALGFFASLDPNGNLIYSSYFVDSGNGAFTANGPAPILGVSSVAVDSNSNIYLALLTNIGGTPALLNPVNGTFQPFFPCPEEDDICSFIEPMVAKVALGSGASFSMPSVM